MGIYIGTIGQIEIKRRSLEGQKESLVNPSDVNASRNRFSFDFDESFLINGDLVEITSTDGTDLDFIDASGWANSTVQTSGNWYVFIDELGGITLYDTFANSLAGGTTGRIPLNAIARNIPIRVNIRGRDYRLVAGVTEYELNTSREAVDITSLSDEHRQQYSTLISGNGRMSAQWDYKNNGNREPVHYLMQLILRTEIGSIFQGKFYVKAENTAAAAGTFSSDQINDALWWEFDGLITNVATAFNPDSVITSSIEFITTGPVRLKAQPLPSDYLLLESGDKISLEQDAASKLLLESVD